jgi:hypothetical protein
VVRARLYPGSKSTTTAVLSLRGQTVPHAFASPPGAWWVGFNRAVLIEGGWLRKVTDFTAVNLGIPKNTEVPFYTENAPDSFGYTANPTGPSYTDQGVGAILATSTNPQWVQLAPQFIGTFQVAKCNVAKRPRSSFIKGYMHNGYFKSLEEVVHFYNTRDALAVCPEALGNGDWRRSRPHLLAGTRGAK